MFPPTSNLVPSQQDPVVPIPDVSKSLRSPQVEASGSTKKKEEYTGQEQQDRLTEAHERFRLCVEYESAFRRNATEELNFVDGLDHWSEGQKRERDGRPCLVFDRIGPSIKQVVNNMRRNPPEPRITPVGEGATKEEADLIQGLLRNVSEDSNARVAFTTGYEHAVKVGKGWWRVHFDWEDDNSFLQKLVIKRIPNLFSVYCDPAAESPDASDMRYCFLTEDWDRKEFEEKYGATRTALVAGGDFQGVSDKIRDDWFPKQAIRIAEYWWIEIEREQICLMRDGKVYPAAQLSPEEKLMVVGRRQVERRKVKGAKITGSEVLEEWDWLGRFIPFIRCIGDELLVNGKKVYRGMIRPAMDGNLAYDYLASKEAEAVGLAPISQWLVAKGQIEGLEYKWADSNRKAFAYLEYNPLDDHNGQPIPPPIRINAEPAVQAITGALMHRDQDIKNVLSTWGPNLGQPVQEQSGRAILAIQSQGDNSHYNYADNLAISQRHTALVCLDLLPHVYSEERLITINDPDGSIRMVPINKEMIEKGIRRIYRLGQDYNPARYDVTIGSGPSYASRKTQQTDAVLQLNQTQPQMMARTLDLTAKLLDLPTEYQDRLRPPDIQQEKEGQAPVPPQVQMQMAQMGQLIEAQTAEIQKLVHIIDTKRIENESKERIATQGNLTRVLTTEISANSNESQSLAQLDHDAVKHQLEQRAELLHSDKPVEEDAQPPQEQQPPQGGSEPNAAPLALEPNNEPFQPNNGPMEPGAPPEQPQ